MSKPVKAFPGSHWVGYLTEHKCKAVRNNKDADHWTARAWIGFPDGSLHIELPCEGYHAHEYLPKNVLQWLIS